LPMADAEPTWTKRISLGWLVCGGMALGAVLVPIGVYAGVAAYDALYGDCSLGPADRFGCGLREFVATALSIIPGGIIGFVVAYWVGRRHAQSS